MRWENGQAIIGRVCSLIAYDFPSRCLTFNTATPYCLRGLPTDYKDRANAYSRRPAKYGQRYLYCCQTVIIYYEHQSRLISNAYPPCVPVLVMSR